MDDDRIRLIHAHKSLVSGPKILVGLLDENGDDLTSLGQKETSVVFRDSGFVNTDYVYFGPIAHNVTIAGFFLLCWDATPLCAGLVTAKVFLLAGNKTCFAPFSLSAAIGGKFQDVAEIRMNLLAENRTAIQRLLVK